MTALVVGPDGLGRCHWAYSAPEYLPYHDEEWGQPVRGDEPLYERLTLEAFQSGLSWITILRKRAAFRAAFGDFALETVAGFGSDDVERLMADQGIVRNRMKIEAAIHNARVALDLPGGLSDFLWAYAVPDQARPATGGDVPAVTAESTAMAKALKKAGFKFFGPTTAYALMQATGMVNDHLIGCMEKPAS
ncbi:DNA-3-methyladenine glycosylase I [Longispora albida]|uniref:DNA-3-methyladenine glycosylase I n=1 Tax=Longispora albida TaxID=203523 RepID=UPI000476250F|nr:DNA-3-methyladenine glycosylase I [Longispora albida]